MTDTGDLHAELWEALREGLAAHFIMWRALDVDGPRGEWFCTCGLKFGLSDTAIDHQRDAVLALPEVADLMQHASTDRCCGGRTGWGHHHRDDGNHWFHPDGYQCPFGYHPARPTTHESAEGGSEG